MPSNKYEDTILQIIINLYHLTATFIKRRTTVISLNNFILNFHDTFLRKN